MSIEYNTLPSTADIQPSQPSQHEQPDIDYDWLNLPHGTERSSVYKSAETDIDRVQDTERGFMTSRYAISNDMTSESTAIPNPESADDHGAEDGGILATARNISANDNGFSLQQDTENQGNVHTVEYDDAQDTHRSNIAPMSARYTPQSSPRNPNTAKYTSADTMMMNSVRSIPTISPLLQTCDDNNDQPNVDKQPSALSDPSAIEYRNSNITAIAETRRDSITAEDNEEREQEQLFFTARSTVSSITQLSESTMRSQTQHNKRYALVLNNGVTCE